MESSFEWKIKPAALLEDLQSLEDNMEVPLSPAALSMLYNRDIVDWQQLKSFCSPDLSQLYSPWLMADMQKAALRLYQAIKEDEHIVVYGDYDVDGTSSVSLLCHYLRACNANYSYYIPDRYSEGYGVSTKGVEQAANRQASLIVCLDCGINAHQAIGLAVSLGLDVIVCDHHLPDALLPPALAILNPKQAACLYPYKELSGCGIGFKLVDAVSQLFGQSAQEFVWPLLDLVAVSIASDLVEMNGENRILAALGLRQLEQNPRPGLEALLISSGLKNPELGYKNPSLDIEKVVFGLGPRINAAGRLAHAHTCVELLMAQDLDQACLIAAQLEDLNIQRRSLDARISEQADVLAQAQAHKASIVVYQPDWHKGVVGIVAARLVEKYNKPTLVLTQSDENIAAGSGRRAAGIDLYAALKTCAHLLDKFGGHVAAAGFSLPLENIDQLASAFEQAVLDQQQKCPERFIKAVLDAECVINLTDITPRFYEFIQKLGPFGPGNMKPLFIAKNIYIYKQKYSIMGRDGTHLRMSLSQQGARGPIEAIGFGLAGFLEVIKESRFDICFAIKENYFQGSKRIQLEIKDIGTNLNNNE